MTGSDNNPCRLCGGKRHQIIMDNIISRYNDRFALVQCDSCALVSTYPLPPEKMLQQYYDTDYWETGHSKTITSLDILYRLRMAPIVSAIQKYISGDSRILDWGCGDGSFINLLRKSGLQCFGIDVYKKELNDPLISSTTIENADFPDGYFDIITCFHVLEHLADPLTSIKHALRLLKTDGLLIIEVPNLNSVGFKIFKRRWQPLEIPTHLNHFTPATLQQVLGAAGRTQIVKTEFFSHRICPSALVQSAFPSLSPRKTRKKFKGHYPIFFLGLYLILQLVAYPFAFAGALVGRGEIVRMYVRKTE